MVAANCKAPDCCRALMRAGADAEVFCDASSKSFGQGRKRVIQRRFNVGVLEAISERKAFTL